jgi:triacylglycerol lipase
VQKKHHVFLVPGFFGFTNLGAFEYWGHVRAFLVDEFARRGLAVEVTAVGSHPTSSLLARAERLARTIRNTAPADAPIHLIGHSSGGLDARLLVAPGVELATSVEDVARRVRSVITVASPHRGTPLASFFANLSAPRFLGTAARILGKGLDPRAELSAFLAEIGTDQALIAQLTPESMELFNATARDRSGVRYACVLTKVDGGRLGVRGPISAAGRAVFALMHQLTMKEGGTDGVVPTGHQTWGEVLFTAEADHLDVLGHEWFHSGSEFTRADFESLWGRVSTVIEEGDRNSRHVRLWIATVAACALAAFGSLWWAMN